MEVLESNREFLDSDRPPQRHHHVLVVNQWKRRQCGWTCMDNTSSMHCSKTIVTTLCGKYSLEACVWGCVCACYGWPDMPSILPHYDHFDGFRSKKWMLNEIICYKLSLSRIIYVINMIFGVVKIFSGKILILFIAYSKSRRPYFPASTHDDVCTDPRISYPLHCTHLLFILCGFSVDSCPSHCEDVS